MFEILTKAQGSPLREGCDNGIDGALEAMVGNYWVGCGLVGAVQCHGVILILPVTY